METNRTSFIVAAALAALTLAGPAVAGLACGDRVSPGQQVVLEEDLACDGPGAAVVVTGPAVVDLNGFTISCADLDEDGAAPQVGVLLLGWAVTVRNGTLNECHHGVVAAGTGFHQIGDVATLFGSGDGIVLASHANRVRGALAFFHRGAGVVLRGAAGNVSDSTATGNRVGFRVDARATLSGNFASANERDGYLVAGSGSVLADNRALGNPFGFTIVGSANSLDGNESRKNLIGVFLDARARSNTLRANVASANTVTGIVADGERNRLVSNRAEDNLAHGIRVPSGARAVAVSGTLAVGNGADDLADETPGCGDNVWRDNRFETRNQVCVE